MFIIELYTDDPIEKVSDWTWITASQHTNEGDRDLQYQRFLDSGITQENLRFKESN